MRPYNKLIIHYYGFFLSLDFLGIRNTSHNRSLSKSCEYYTTYCRGRTWDIELNAKCHSNTRGWVFDQIDL